MKVDEALGLLRAADPAAGTDEARRVPGIRLTEAPRRRLWPAVAAATVLATALALFVALVQSHRTPSGHGAATQASTTRANRLIEPGAPDPNPARTRALLAALLASMPALPRSVSHDRAPVTILRYALTSHGSSTHEVRLTRWFTAPGSSAQAAAFFAAHIPPGLARGDMFGGEGLVGLDFDVRQDRSGGATEAASVSVGIVPNAGGVAVRIDAYGFWLPSRTTDSIIGVPSAAIATATVSDADPRQASAKPVPLVRRLNRDAARRLARLVDALPGGVDVSHSCGFRPVGVSERVVFRTSRGIYTVVPTDSSCGITTHLRTPNGRDYPLGPGTLFADVLAAMGLPRDYGQR